MPKMCLLFIYKEEELCLIKHAQMEGEQILFSQQKPNYLIAINCSAL
jgi:hypothetical protein